MKPETLTYSGLHVSAACLTGEQLNRGEFTPIFSPMLDGEMEKQTDSRCTGTEDGRARGRARGSLCEGERGSEREEEE